MIKFDIENRKGITYHCIIQGRVYDNAAGTYYMKLQNKTLREIYHYLQRDDIVCYIPDLYSYTPFNGVPFEKFNFLNSIAFDTVEDVMKFLMMFNHLKNRIYKFNNTTRNYSR